MLAILVVIDSFERQGRAPHSRGLRHPCGIVISSNGFVVRGNAQAPAMRTLERLRSPQNATKTRCLGLPADFLGYRIGARPWKDRVLVRLHAPTGWLVAALMCRAPRVRKIRPTCRGNTHPVRTALGDWRIDPVGKQVCPGARLG